MEIFYLNNTDNYFFLLNKRFIFNETNDKKVDPLIAPNNQCTPKEISQFLEKCESKAEKVKSKAEVDLLLLE